MMSLTYSDGGTLVACGHFAAVDVGVVQTKLMRRYEELTSKERFG